MSSYLIKELWRNSLAFYDAYERLVDGVKLIARREEFNDFTKIEIEFPDSSELPSDEDDLELNDYKFHIISIEGDMDVYWDIDGDIDEDKKGELLEEVEEDDNEDEKWILIKDSHEAILHNGYVILEKL
ncbi:hypothetical protein [Halomonas sp. GFAJ-1]|uniref:hypothetical protein n=1 Tax=Halomonas sp. GFAJ-1 TaxID=1118153 RepID=UPI00023A206B|nr:hypothetical protein [Halomonas sp. GFAJ-1]AVI62505.1 hypothetical protein BB497_07230 [Halomonas sp. GFAJ-1]EHK59512.1 hypothetical protein MOY_16013 [Halomonas sp. GFAJ-1]